MERKPVGMREPEWQLRTGKVAAHPSGFPSPRLTVTCPRRRSSRRGWGRGAQEPTAGAAGSLQNPDVRPCLGGSRPDCRPGRFRRAFAPIPQFGSSAATYPAPPTRGAPEIAPVDPKPGPLSVNGVTLVSQQLASLPSGMAPVESRGCRLAGRGGVQSQAVTEAHSAGGPRTREAECCALPAPRLDAPPSERHHRVLVVSRVLGACGHAGGDALAPAAASRPPAGRPLGPRHHRGSHDGIACNRTPPADGSSRQRGT